MGFDEADNETWEPLASVMEDESGTLEDFLQSPGDRNMKREILDLYS